MPQCLWTQIYLLKSYVSWVKWGNYFLCIWMTVLNIHINHCWAKSLYYISSCYSVVISSSIFTLLFFNFPCFQGLNFVYMLWCCLLADSVLAILNSASCRVAWRTESGRTDYSEGRILPTRVPYILLKSSVAFCSTGKMQRWCNAVL